jgi:hypothetical protein
MDFWIFKKMEIYFFGSASEIWIRIQKPDPDPRTQLNPHPIRICIRNIDQDSSV